MDLQTKKSGLVVIIQPLSKNIDATVSTTFKARVIDQINQNNHLILLNFSDVNFVDSSGLGALISILKTLRMNGGNVALCNIREPVLNLFKLTHMDSVIQIFPSEKEAMEYLLTEIKV